MGMKRLPNFFSHSKSFPSSHSPWLWPSCANLKTLSFRSTNPKDDNFRTFNSAFLDSASSRSFSTSSEDTCDPIETVIRGLHSDRLFYEPEESSSLVSTPPLQETEEEEEGVGYKESEMLSMESENPYDDFRRSMEEMVQVHGLNDWEGLQELLKCYLKINGKTNHGYIMAAFTHLLLNTISFNSLSSSPSSPFSLPSSSLSSTLDHDHHHDDQEEHVPS